MLVLMLVYVVELVVLIMELEWVVHVVFVLVFEMAVELSAGGGGSEGCDIRISGGDICNSSGGRDYDVDVGVGDGWGFDDGIWWQW